MREGRKKRRKICHTKYNIRRSAEWGTRAKGKNLADRFGKQRKVVVGKKCCPLAIYLRHMLRPTAAPRNHGLGRRCPPVKACRLERSGCCTHFGVRLRIGQDVCHATVHKTRPVCRQERTIWSRKSPFFGRVQLHPRTPSQTFRGTQKSSHLGNGGIAQEVHQMAKGGRIATTDSGCVITTTTFLQHPTLPIF